MKILKYILIVLLLSLAGFFAYLKLTKAETIIMGGQEVSLENPWVEFNEADDSNIGNLIRAYQFEEGEKMFKKDIGYDAFLIACLKKNKNWNYYYYYRGPETYEMMTISEEIEKEISSP